MGVILGQLYSLSTKGGDLVMCHNIWEIERDKRRGERGEEEEELQYNGYNNH